MNSLSVQNGLDKPIRKEPKEKECHVCGAKEKEESGFTCNDCGEFTCNLCGDGDLCNLCIGDELFIGDILDLEK